MPTCVSFSTGPLLVRRRYFLEPPERARDQTPWPRLVGLPTFGDSSRCFNLTTECRNINLPSIGYAFRPRLRFRLTLGGFTFPRKP